MADGLNAQDLLNQLERYLTIAQDGLQVAQKDMVKLTEERDALAAALDKVLDKLSSECPAEYILVCPTVILAERDNRVRAEALNEVASVFDSLAAEPWTYIYGAGGERIDVQRCDSITAIVAKVRAMLAGATMEQV